MFVTEVKVAGRPLEVFDALFKIESSFRAKIIALEVGSFVSFFITVFDPSILFVSYMIHGPSSCVLLFSSYTCLCLD